MSKNRGLGTSINRRTLMKASLLGGGVAMMHALFAGSTLNAALFAGARWPNESAARGLHSPRQGIRIPRASRTGLRTQPRIET